MTRSQRWKCLDHGVHIQRDAPDPFTAGLRAWRDSLSGEVIFTSLTAARAYEMWLPPLPPDLPVFVTAGPDHAQCVRAGCRLRRERIRPATRELGGVLLATPAEALLAAAREVSLLDLVVLIDGAAHLKLATHAELEALASASRHGAPALRRGLKWADRSESAWETVLRMLHTTAGLPVRPQVDILDNAGSFIARADLLLAATRMLHEYDGADHRTLVGQRRDLNRDRRLLAVGFQRRGFVSRDISGRPEEILREACTTLGVPYGAEMLHRWLEVWEASLFSPLGMFDARRRWGMR